MRISITRATTTFYRGDYERAYSFSPSFYWRGGYVEPLSAWQSVSGQDAHSVYFKPEDQTSGNSHALWLGVATGTNNGPSDGDWRINPGARVYDSADAAYIGKFPDGAPITQAGPQTHWNY